MDRSEPAPLLRGIRRWDLVALVINSVIGAGIFGLPSEVYRLTGPYSLAAFLVCAALVVLLVLCFAEVTSRFTATGGPYLFARQVFPGWFAFQVGWLLWLTRLTAFAAICNLLVTYLAHFWPQVELPAWRAGIITAVIATFTAVNLVGVRTSAMVSNVFTIGKLLPLALFVAVGLYFIEPQQYSAATMPNAGQFAEGVLLLVYAFTGFEIPIIASGEVRDPRGDFPFALLAGIGVVVLFYVLIQAVCIGTLPELAESKRPVADAAGRFLGAAGASLISLGAIVSMTGTLNVTLLAGSRLPYALAEQGQLPQWLGRTHARFHTPHIAILVSAAVLLAITLSGTFVLAAKLSTIARLMIYAVTCIALLQLRRTDEPPASFRAPGGVAVALVCLGLIAWLLYGIFADPEKQAEQLAVASALVAGVVLWGIGNLAKRA